MICIYYFLYICDSLTLKKHNIMKKNYFLLAIFSLTMLSMNAQVEFEDDMESYGGGNAPIYEGHWSDWSCGGTCAMWSSGDQAQSGVLSGYVGDDVAQDAVLLLGNKIFGQWGLEFSSYVPAGKVGYWNLQGDEAPGIQYVVGNIYFGNGVANQGIGEIDMSTADIADDIIFAFPHGQWFNTVINFDFSAGATLATWEMWVDGVEVVPAGTAYADGAGEQALAVGGIDFYSISADHMMYVDDLLYQDGFIDPSLGTADFASTGFRSALNNDILTLKANEDISNVAIYNMLGQEVYNSSVNTSSINMSSFANGTYIVRVNISGIEGTVKIVK